MESLANKRVMVTGGAGFIGSNLVKTLIRQHGSHVIVLDDLYTGSLENLAGLDCEFVQGSVENEELVDACMQHVDIVFHLASRNIILSNKNPREDLNVNVKGSFNVFGACLKHHVARIVYTSTSSIYGEPESLPISENDAKKYLNFYSASKFSAEVYARTFFEVFCLPITIVRYSNVYGMNQLPKNPYCGVIGKFLESAFSGRPIKVHGNGAQTRDYTYIDDAVDVTIAAAIYADAVGEDYNIGTGEETSVNDLANHIIEITGSTSGIQYIKNRDIDNISRRCINFGKARKDLKYEPRYTIRKGLEKTADWFYKAYESVGLGLIMSANML
jgi:UDP-glucose 4-epimerase